MAGIMAGYPLETYNPQEDDTIPRDPDLAPVIVNTALEDLAAALEAGVTVYSGDGTYPEESEA